MKRIPVDKQLYLSVMALFLVFAAVFIVFQQKREKQFKIDALNARLQNYNDRMQDWLSYQGRHDEATLNGYVSRHRADGIRVTLIDKHGKVFFDNIRKNYASISNHANRKEVVQALRSGRGSTVERNSATLKREYFYSATWYPQEGFIIRSALPYDNNLSKSLQADQHFIWFAVAAFIILTFILYRFTNRLGRNLTKLRSFAYKADHNESLDSEDLADFPDDELGEIAERIIKMYKRLQSTRQQQDILKRQLTQNIAHELKTPVASIQGYLETITENPQMDEPTREQFLQRCYAQSERLTSLLRDISTLNRMDDAPEMMDFEQVDIAGLVHDIQKETALQLESRNMRFHNLLPATLVVQGNRSLLYSVFRNLTDNAIAYAGTGTDITLTAHEQDGLWQFSFADNGVGVPAQHLPRLFERFYRIDKGRSRKMGGTGLGLAIVKNAVLIHKGQISVSNNPEGGLQFVFTIPTTGRKG